jgi:uncharacterized protein
MRMLFTDQAQPFFAQADLVEIGPLSDYAVTVIVQDGFEASRRSTNGTTSWLVRTAEGHPQRAMQLADALWRYTPEGATADESTWVDALDDVRANVASGMERLYALLPVGHQKALRAIAADGRVYGRTAEVLELAPGTAAAAVDALVGGGQVAKRQARLVIIDPLFGDWIRRRFPLPS